jgi:hypothetical protein
MLVYAILPRNYLHIKQDVHEIVNSAIERVLNDPGSERLALKQTI